jgi:hypothetical protein
MVQLGKAAENVAGFYYLGLFVKDFSGPYKVAESFL